MKRIILITVILTGGLAVHAQQLQTSSMYDVQGILHNPSIAGTTKNNEIGISYKSQWSGISGSPKTAMVFGSFNLPKYAAGIGGYIYQDKTGPTSRSGMVLSLAKHIVGNKGVFSLGIENKFLQYSIDKSKLTQSLGTDPILGGATNTFKYDAGFGMSYTTKSFQLGAAVSQLIQSKLNLYNGNLNTTEQAMLYRHYYLHGYYHWDVDGSTVITPNFLLIYLPKAPVDYQAGARIDFENKLWVGGGYRVNQSFSLSAGINISKNFTIGYAYDNYINPISDFDKGSSGHEILLKYNFKK